jgi:hypothetical protein
MILMSFFSFVVLIASLFILNLNGAFVCDDPSMAGICTLRDRFQGYRVLITGSTTLIVVFIILASYFQKFFLVKKPRKKKETVKKVKDMFSKDQNLAVFEVEPAPSEAAPKKDAPPVKDKRKRKKRKPALAEYTITEARDDGSLDAIKQSVFTQPDRPLKLPKDLVEIDDEDSEYLESETPVAQAPTDPSTEGIDQDGEHLDESDEASKAALSADKQNQKDLNT